MTEHIALLKEIDKLPPKYFGEVFDFVGYLRHKAHQETDDTFGAYQAMAADTEREQEAHEWCGAIEDVRRLLQKEMVEQGTSAVHALAGDGWTAHVREHYAEP